MPLYYADYPIFGLCCTRDSIILSGGGGGKDYGIEDQIELYELGNCETECQKLNANDKISTESSLMLKFIYNTTKQNGVLDSMCFNNKLNLVAGGIKECCILFYIEEGKKGKSIRMYLQFQTVWDESKKGKQNVCRFSKDGKLLITGGTDNIVRVWELNTETENKQEIFPLAMKEFHGHENEILDLDISSDNKFIISSSRNGTIIVHNYSSGEIFKKFTVPMKNGNYIVRQCRFIENGRLNSPRKQKNNDRQQYIVSMLLHEVRGSSFITVWNMKISKENANENPNNRIVFAQIASNLICDKPSSVLVISDDNNLLAVGTNTGLIKIFKNNLTELTPVKEGIFHELPVTGLQFFNSNEYIISAGADYSISVLNVNSRKNSLRSNKKQVTKARNNKSRGPFGFGMKIIKYTFFTIFTIVFIATFINYSVDIGVNLQSSIRDGNQSAEL
ncbi:WD40 repeat containing that has a transmembrane region at the C-terminus [Cryptosporidium sp. chipmunk genotype I]|uniref:WD40 repeat containing that has a transmembrane region at the C-terminus n=1 Tax=Cryptosporidium sp. chipmunk genotype I TaxID=1280935 RepID=UPI00351A37F7|nr:WD40 repeat containing that has a transmembrane region at the C-terminus [Cryptosporidium sp. chipmunk genotype I]